MDNNIFIHIISRCTRLNNLPDIEDSVFNTPENIKVKWHLIFDVGTLKEIPIEIYERYKGKNVEYHYEKVGSRSLSVVNPVVELISADEDSWIYFLDDDNIIHEDFYKKMSLAIPNNPDVKGYIFSQNVDGKDFTKLDTRLASPDNIKLQHVDLAQYFLHRSMFGGDHWFRPRSWGSDGVFIEELYRDRKDDFKVIPDILCHYNYLEKVSSARVPKVLYIGENEPEMKSSLKYSKYTDELITKYIKSDKGIASIIAEFKPDAIVTSGESWKDYPELAKQPIEVRKKWINIPENEQNENLGQAAYMCASNQMLANDNSKLISYFTPIYNTGEKLRKTYECLKNQTYNNWEWVLVNDSTDMGRTLRIAEDLAAKDPRVKVYDFREKSGGNIGEAKYRAAMLCRGHILAELDHDDHITPKLTEWLQRASEDHPECGFFYSDCASATPDWQPRWFNGLHAFGYGNYREEVYNGVNLKVTNQHNINPVTIRHIVGVPNHVRAWRRSTYMEIGGHCRDLSIADDYELVVRTFLVTRVCRIPHLGYVQFMYDGGSSRNTHDIVRMDIQRRVKTIAEFYHEDIKKRFDELGLHDWAYERDPKDSTKSWYSPWPTGKEEQSASIIWLGDE